MSRFAREYLELKKWLTMFLLDAENGTKNRLIWKGTSLLAQQIVQ